MSQSLARCPGCQSPYAPRTTICPTCGRVLGDPALRTRQIDDATLAPPPIGPAAPPLKAGQPIAQGRYTILRPLSQGGMGALYLATDREAFDRTVVIKVLLEYGNRGDPREVQAARARFEHEARTLATLAYPTIPQIFSYFQDGPHHCIVMAYVEGRDLAQGLTRQDAATPQMVSGRPYPLKDVLRWGVALCRTLEYLASRTPPVVHHDIKPANLILNPQSGELFLVDFGAARMRAALPAGGAAQTAIFGTPGYAAIEQYQGQSDPSSDVYALAATLYHLITDDDPSAHPFQFPRLAYLGYLGPILRAALSTDRAQRPNAAALREQIEALLTPEGHRVLHTPDQVALASEAELAAWCEAHWQAAASWLYDGMPDHVQMAWVKLGLAANLRQCVQQHPRDRNAGLDAAIELLDRTGFGAAAPELAADCAAIELNTFAPGGEAEIMNGQLVIRNTGRRYVQARVAAPKWLATPTPSVALAPGEQATLPLRLDHSIMPIAPRDAAVVVRAADGTGVALPVRGQPPAPDRQPPSPIAIAVFMAVFALMCALMFLVPALQR